MENNFSTLVAKRDVLVAFFAGSISGAVPSP